LFISSYLAFIRLAEADNADTLDGFHEHPRLQAAIQESKATITRLAVIVPVIHSKYRRLEIKVRRPLETQTTQLDVFGILGGVVSDLHVIYCMHTIDGHQSFLCIRLRTPQSRGSGASGCSRCSGQAGGLGSAAVNGFFGANFI
jgi:hypothetical protein